MHNYYVAGASAAGRWFHYEKLRAQLQQLPGWPGLPGHLQQLPVHHIHDQRNRGPVSEADLPFGGHQYEQILRLAHQASSNIQLPVGEHFSSTVVTGLGKRLPWALYGEPE